MIFNCYQPLWDSGLVIWFSPWVQEDPGSTPGCPQLGILQIIGSKNSMFSGKLRFLRN